MYKRNKSKCKLVSPERSIIRNAAAAYNSGKPLDCYGWWCKSELDFINARVEFDEPVRASNLAYYIINGHCKGEDDEEE